MLIAPAVDFTEELMWKKFSPEVQRQIETEGSWQRPSQYSEAPYPITRGLIEEGRKHLLLGGLIETGCPVRILQGVQDPDVPWQHAVELSSRLARDDVVLTLVKDGDHRLSRPEDIERLIAAVAEFCKIRSNAGVGDHLGPARDVLGDQRLEVVGRAALGLAAERVDVLHHGGLGDQRVDVGVEPRRDRRRQLGRADQAHPRGDGKSGEARLGDGADVRQRRVARSRR